MFARGLVAPDPPPDAARRRWSRSDQERAGMWSPRDHLTLGVGRAATTFGHRHAGVVRRGPECALTWLRGSHLSAKPGRPATTPSRLRRQKGRSWLQGDQARRQSGWDGTSFGGKLVVTEPVSCIERKGWSRTNQLSRKVGLYKTRFASNLALWRPPSPPCARSWSRADQDVSRTGSQATNRLRILVANRPVCRLSGRGDRGGGA